MPLQIIIIYALGDTLLQIYGHKDDKQTSLTMAEVMTAVLVAVWFFYGN